MVDWLVCLFYSVSTVFGSFNAELGQFAKSSNNSVWHNHRFLFTNSLNISKQFYFKQFSLAWVEFSSIWHKDWTLFGATTPGQSWAGSDGNEGVLRIPQSSSITEASPSDCLVSYLGHSFGVSYPSEERRSRSIL